LETQRRNDKYLAANFRAFFSSPQHKNFIFFSFSLSSSSPLSSLLGAAQAWHSVFYRHVTAYLSQPQEAHVVSLHDVIVHFIATRSSSSSGKGVGHGPLCLK
jgi:hypothetical protein